MKILFLWLMPILLIIGSTNEANARSKKKKGKAKTEQQLLYLMPLPISLVPIKMYSILADAVMEVCSQL